MTRVSRKTTINILSDVIWQLISKLGAACHYLAMVVNCTVAGEGVGARRTLTSADGNSIVERLEALDGDARQLSYALLTDTPFRNCLTTIALRDLGLHQAELEWSATFEADGLPASEAAELMEGALAANCVALKQFIEC